MRSEFWLERWRNGQTGWHQPQVNRWLAKHWPALGLASECPVFVPLCGKSLDMAWLRALGHRVIGVELAESVPFSLRLGTKNSISRSLNSSGEPHLGLVAALRRTNTRR